MSVNEIYVNLFLLMLPKLKALFFTLIKYIYSCIKVIKKYNKSEYGFRKFHL